MFKRFRLLLALVALVALVAAACGSDDDTAETSDTTAAPTTTEAMDDEESTTTEAMEEETTTTEAPAPAATLVIWADENRVNALNDVAPAFTEATGVDVQIDLVDFGEIRDQVQTAGPAGEGPDIFVGAHDWTGELAANGVIDPIDISAVRDDFVAAALQGFNFEGQNFAIPYATEAIALYRNTDLAPDAPGSWDDIEAACAATSPANCVVVPGGGAGADAYHNYPFVSAYGGGIFAFDDSTGFDASTVLLDSPETIQGIEFLENAVDAGIVASTDYDTAKNLWLEGEAAYWMTGPWELGNVRDQSTVPNWDVSIIPAFGDDPAEPFVGAQGFFLSAFSENELIAQSFLTDFLATDEAMQSLYDADPRGTAWNNVLAGLTEDLQVAAFAESASNGIPMPNIPQMGSVWGPLGDNVLLVRNGELGADEAMTTAAEAVRSAIAG